MKKYFTKKETCKIDSLEIGELETAIDEQAYKIKVIRQNILGAEHSVCPNYKKHLESRKLKELYRLDYLLNVYECKTKEIDNVKTSM